MSSMSNPKPWTPYDSSYTDCSQGICNIYCPQWCYLILPPPPPSFFNDEENSSSSPLLIALIGILATAFILVSYYTLISKYCHRHHETSSSNGGFFSSNAASGDGLIDSVIKSITVYKYRKEDGFVDGSDCSVCLSEFEENESLRLLPKCNHAFHLPCIDTWLKSHSNCPLCRAFVTGVNPATTTTTATESGNRGGGISNIADYQHQSGETVVVIADLEIGSRNVNGRTQSQSQPPEEQGERKDDENPATIRRSVSLNSGTVVVVSVADVLREIEDDERDGESSGVGTSQQWRDGKTPSLTAANQRSGGVSSFLVRSTVAMKRSVSTGRFIFSSKMLPN